MSEQPTGTSQYYTMVPEELLFVFEYPDAGSYDESAVNTFLTNNFTNYTTGVDRGRVAHFDRTNHAETTQNTSRLTFLTCKFEGMQPDEMVNKLFELQATYNPRNETETRNLDGTSMALRAVSPNWLMSGMPNEPGPTDGGAGGGSVTKPVAPNPAVDAQFNQVSIDDPNAPWGYKFDEGAASSISTDQQAAIDVLKDALSKRFEVSDRDVEIAILDTAPQTYVDVKETKAVRQVRTLVEAYNEFKDTHPIIKSLFEPGGLNGPFKNIRISYDKDFVSIPAIQAITNFDLPRAHPEGYPYYAIDHGTFIAGIIHTLAPSIKLHLIEVLNARGVGTIEKVALGLQKARDDAQAQGKRLVVNMSLAFSFSWLNRASISSEQFARMNADEKRVVDAILDDGNFRSDMEQLGRWLAELVKFDDAAMTSEDIVENGGLVVAAAGNDNTQAQTPRPPTRYPAAFDSVVGVGALNESHDPTVYSNEPDIPIESGVWTFGGKEEPKGWAHEKFGVLGMYIGKYPDPNLAPDTDNVLPNDTGWARWAGTSFAAPVVTGCLALLISQGLTAQAALDTIRNGLLIPSSGSNAHWLPLIQNL